MNRLDKITEALGDVEKARAQCPFHGSYTGHQVNAFGSPCGKCGARQNGDGGTCVIAHAEHRAVLAIEEAVA